ncbi:unnamed protein product [Brassica rapa]|uniref:Uncharacterized protein n=1 Tax=Brassica campestris TaxID=3711 RepID=A0A8D9DA15_BRACM|nr:unnamed protein product [Brassica rapa]
MHHVSTHISTLALSVNCGGSNLCDKGLNPSGSWQQGHSTIYNTLSHI